MIGADAEIDAETAPHRTERQRGAIAARQLLRQAEAVAPVADPCSERRREAVIRLGRNVTVHHALHRPVCRHRERRLPCACTHLDSPWLLGLFDVTAVNVGHGHRVDESLHPHQTLHHKVLVLLRLAPFSQRHEGHQGQHHEHTSFPHTIYNYLDAKLCIFSDNTKLFNEKESLQTPRVIMSPKKTAKSYNLTILQSYIV